MKAVKLKLSTHMDTGLMYCVYQDQGQGPITLRLEVHLLIGFTICHSRKILVTFFQRTARVTKLKPGIQMDSGLMYCVYQSQGQGPITLGVTSLDRLYNLP